MLDHERLETFLVEATVHQALVERAMGAAKLGLQGELGDRGHRSAGTQRGITELEEGIAPARQAPVGCIECIEKVPTPPAVRACQTAGTLAGARLG